MIPEIVRSTDIENEYIHQQLQRHNAPYMVNWEDLSFHIKDGEQIIAGIVAERTVDTVEVAFLFVDEAHRKQGLGRALLERVEAIAQEKGVQRIHLNTYSFQAPEFYRKLGYQEVLRLTPCFGEHEQFYYIKRLLRTDDSCVKLDNSRN